jgi:hypothetical protein
LSWGSGDASQYVHGTQNPGYFVRGHIGRIDIALHGEVIVSFCVQSNSYSMDKQLDNIQ